MFAFNQPLSIIAALLALASACRSQLPLPSAQPPPQAHEDSPGSSTNDRLLPGPVAADSLGSGGTNLLPSPTPPGGSGGSGGTVGP